VFRTSEFESLQAGVRSIIKLNKKRNIFDAVELFDGAWGGHVFERISDAAKSRGYEKPSSNCRTRIAARGGANPPGGDPKSGPALWADRGELSQAVTRFAQR
jgi:hypothetical protein